MTRQANDYPYMIDENDPLLDSDLSLGQVLSPAYFPAFFVFNNNTFLYVHEELDEKKFMVFDQAPIISLSKSIFFNRCFSYVDIVYNFYISTKNGKYIYDVDLIFNVNKEAFLYYEKASNQHPVAAFMCGQYLYQNRFNIQSNQKSYSFFQKSADLGNKMAARIMETNYQYDAFVHISSTLIHIPDVIYYWLERVRLNNAQAFYQLSFFAVDKKVGINNQILSLKMLKKAANLGIFDAQIKCAKIFSPTIKYWGDAFVNKDKAKYYWGISAYNSMSESLSEHTLACFQYAKYLLEDKIYQKSFDFFKLAAIQKHTESQFYCGCAYANFKPFENVGLDVPISNSEAFKYFKAASLSLHADASYLAGYFYLNGIGTKKHLDLAELHFRRAANKKHPEANYQLGLLLKSSNDRIAFSIFPFLTAGRLKYYPAFLECGMIYAHLPPYCGNLSVAKDYDIALFYFKKATEHNCAQAAYYCFLMIRKHPNLAKNKNERVFYLNRTVQLKHPKVLRESITIDDIF